MAAKLQTCSVTLVMILYYAVKLCVFMYGETVQFCVGISLEAGCLSASEKVLEFFSRKS